jgi:hypothetical protein
MPRADQYRADDERASDRQEAGGHDQVTARNRWRDGSRQDGAEGRMERHRHRTVNAYTRDDPIDVDVIAARLRERFDLKP